MVAYTGTPSRWVHTCFYIIVTGDFVLFFEEDEDSDKVDESEGMKLLCLSLLLLIILVCRFCAHLIWVFSVYHLYACVSNCFLCCSCLIDEALSADSDDESVSSSSESSSSSSASSSSSDDEDEEEGEQAAESESLDTMDESTMDSVAVIDTEKDERCVLLWDLKSWKNFCQLTDSLKLNHFRFVLKGQSKFRPIISDHCRGQTRSASPKENLSIF